MDQATAQGSQEDELRQLVDEQSALRRVATLVAAGGSTTDIVAAVTTEIARLFGAERATTMRWEGDTTRVIGEWSADESARMTGRVFAFGGDTLAARVVNASAPARIDRAEEMRSELGRERWAELGFQSSIGAPIIVDGLLWGVITATRTTSNHPFQPGAEHRLGDFASLVAQAIANAEARRELGAVAEEQAALRRVATLVAGGKPQREVVEAVMHHAGHVLGAQALYHVRWEGRHDEVAVVAGWTDGTEQALAPRTLYHPEPSGATLRLLETGLAIRCSESSQELGEREALAAPVIVAARLLGALIALRPAGDEFPEGAEIRLRSFSDLLAQSLANEQAQEEMRASRARIVRAGDEARQRLERNLHDGAQQRLVAVSLALRLAVAKLPDEPVAAREVLGGACDELSQALDELRELARGLHPAILTDQGLGPALEVLARRSPVRAVVAYELVEPLPAPVEAAAYYLVAEALTNIAKHAEASRVEIRVTRRGACATVEVKDDGVGGADTSGGSGLRGLADRVEALAGRLGVESPPGSGTRIWAEIPVELELGGSRNGEPA